MNIAQPQPSENQNPQIAIQTVSYGARTFCSILVHYTGKRMTVEEQLHTINEHLERDGRKRIARSTFFRWKGEARAAGMLRFKSKAWRRRDRGRLTANQQRREHGNGTQMTVAAIPFAVAGRRLRRVNETFSAPPANETFSAPITHKDSAPRKDHPEGVEVCASATRTAPAPAAFFSREEKETERWLTEVAEEAASYTGYPYQARAEHFHKRAGAIRKALKETDANELGRYVVGLAVERAKKPDWWESEGRDFDLVARAVAFAYQEHLYPHHETLLHYGDGLIQEIELHREAMVGSG